jgi:hypothetical protein
MDRRFGIALGFLILLGASRSRAQGKEQFFLTGNTAYQEGRYEDALASYKKIVEMGFTSGPLYFNMGNCYYKMREIGRTVLFYERAKKFIPKDEDLKFNLSLANLAVVDKIEQREPFLLFRIVRGFTHLMPQAVLMWVVAGSYLMFISAAIVWIASRRPAVRMLGFRLGILFGILFLVFGLSLIGRIRESKDTVEGVILEDRVDVMSAPSDGEGVEVFSLHEGTKVRLDQRSGEWVEIVLADGKVGWVKREVLEII